MTLLSYTDLMDAIEAERLRLRAHNQMTSGGEHYAVVTPDFAKGYDDDALIRGAARLRSFSPTEARWAATLLETELHLRQIESDRRNKQVAFRTLVAAVAAAVFGFIALFK